MIYTTFFKEQRMKIIKSILFSLITSALMFLHYAYADPLTDEQIASFSTSNLMAKSFDKRMETFRIIEQKGWQEKYKKEAIEAIKAQLTSSDVMLNRTGIQAQNMLMYRDNKIDDLIINRAEAYHYSKDNQAFYFQQSLIEYMGKKILIMRNLNQLCEDTKAPLHDYARDWDTFVQAVINKDLRGVSAFSGSDSIDAEALIEVLHHPLVLSVLKKTDYADLTPIKNDETGGETVYEFSTDKSKNNKNNHSVKLYFSKGDTLVLDYYLAPN